MSTEVALPLLPHFYLYDHDYITYPHHHPVPSRISNSDPSPFQHPSNSPTGPSPQTKEQRTEQPIPGNLPEGGKVPGRRDINDIGKTSSRLESSTQGQTFLDLPQNSGRCAEMEGSSEQCSNSSRGEEISEAEDPRESDLLDVISSDCIEELSTSKRIRELGLPQTEPTSRNLGIRSKFDDKREKQRRFRNARLRNVRIPKGSHVPGRDEPAVKALHRSDKGRNNEIRIDPDVLAHGYFATRKTNCGLKDFDFIRQELINELETELGKLNPYFGKMLITDSHLLQKKTNKSKFKALGRAGPEPQEKMTIDRLRAEKMSIARNESFSPAQRRHMIKVISNRFERMKKASAMLTLNEEAKHFVETMESLEAGQERLTFLQHPSSRILIRTVVKYFHDYTGKPVLKPTEIERLILDEEFDKLDQYFHDLAKPPSGSDMATGGILGFFSGPTPGIPMKFHEFCARKTEIQGTQKKRSTIAEIRKLAFAYERQKKSLCHRILRIQAEEFVRLYESLTTQEALREFAMHPSTRIFQSWVPRFIRNFHGKSLGGIFAPSGSPKDDVVCFTNVGLFGPSSYSNGSSACTSPRGSNYSTPRCSPGPFQMSEYIPQTRPLAPVLASEEEQMDTDEDEIDVLD